MEYDVQALSIEETRRRKSLSDEARNMVKQSLTIEEEDDTGLMMMFEDFYLQISFSELHPLMVIYLVRYLERKISIHDKDKVNKLNLASVLGGHTVDTGIGCYAYRTTHWLDAPLTRERDHPDPQLVANIGCKRYYPVSRKGGHTYETDDTAYTDSYVAV